MSNTWESFAKKLEGISIERAIHYTCVLPLFAYEHVHADKFHIAFIFSGNSRIIVNKEISDIGPSDLIYIPSRVLHGSIGDENVHYDLIEVHFLARTNAHGLAVPSFPTVTHVQDRASIISALERLIVSHAVDSSPDNWRSKVLLMDVLMLLEVEGARAAVPHTVKGQTHMKIDQAKEHIALHYQDPLTVEGLAELVVMSSSYFAASFRSITGMSPIQFVIHVRLHHAKELLKHSDLSVKQIASICGFSTSEYFIRLFTQRQGISPHRYRSASTDA